MIRPLVQYRDHEDCVRRAATLAGLVEYDPARAPTVAQYLRGEAPK